MEMPPIFYEIHSNLPRQGPGDNQSTAKAFQKLKNMPTVPCILDIGCGSGMQTIEIAKLSNGQIVAVDRHQPFLDQLILAAKKAGLSDRINAVKGDMFNLKYPKESFDIIWCEGAIFIIGFERGLREWRPLLKMGGYIVISELSFFRPDPPLELSDYLKEMYAGLENSEANSIEKNIETAKKADYTVLDTFTIPKSSWWDNYYSPIETKLPILRAKYKDDPEALCCLDSEQKEIDMYRKYSDYYGYAFYVLEKT